MQRRKGASYEREVAAAIYAVTGQKIGRKLGQARDSGNDLDLGPFVIECKRRKTLGTIYGWYRQAVAAVKGKAKIPAFDVTPGGSLIHEGETRQIDKIPIVIMREDNGTSFVLLGLNDFLNVAVDAHYVEYIPHTPWLPASENSND